MSKQIFSVIPITRYAVLHVIEDGNGMSGSSTVNEFKTLEAAVNCANGFVSLLPGSRVEMRVDDDKLFSHTEWETLVRDALYLVNNAIRTADWTKHTTDEAVKVCLAAIDRIKRDEVTSEGSSLESSPQSAGSRQYSGDANLQKPALAPRGRS